MLPTRSSHIRRSMRPASHEPPTLHVPKARALLPHPALISPFGAALSATRYRRSRAAPAVVAPGAVMGTRPSR